MSDAQAVSPLPSAEIIRLRAVDPLVIACNGAREAGQEFAKDDIRSDKTLRQTLLRCLTAYRLGRADPDGLALFAKTLQIEPPRKCRDPQALLVVWIAFGKEGSRTFGQRQSGWASTVVALDHSDPASDPAKLLKVPGVDWLSRHAERGWWPTDEDEGKPDAQSEHEPSDPSEPGPAAEPEPQRKPLPRRLLKRLRNWKLQDARPFAEVESDLSWHVPTVLIAMGPAVVVVNANDPRYHDLVRSRLNLCDAITDSGDSNIDADGIVSPTD